jgi:predicted secreted hydrolase
VGQLEDAADPAKRYGYQLTFFRIGVLPERPALDSAWATADLVMAHAAVTDLAAGEHHFREVLHRAVPLLGGFPGEPESLLAWTRPPPGGSERWSVRWNGDGFDLSMTDDAGGMSFRLSTRPQRPLVLQGPNGYSRKGQGAGFASQYYSITRLETEGSVTLNGRSFTVRGVSWMDREFGSDLLDEDQVGWDWFSLQLDDGRDLMLFRLRDADGETDFSRATLISASGEASYLEDDHWTLRATGSWTSPESDATYPARWTLELPGEGLRLEIVPALADQENRGRIAYWEGVVTVLDADGRPLGRGYAELTGYGAGNRPEL